MTVQSDESLRNGRDQARSNRGAWTSILLALVAVAAIVMLKSQKMPVDDSAPRIDYPALVKQKTDEASRQDDLARRRFEDSLAKEMARYEPWFEYAAKKSSLHVATPEAMGAIVYHLARDKVLNTQDTDAYLDEALGPILKPIANAYARDVGTVMNRFEYDLRSISVKLATDLAAIGPGDPQTPQRAIPNVANWQSFDQVLKNLGFNVATVGVSTVFDASAIVSSRIGPEVLKRIAAIASRMFAKQVVRIAAIPVLVTMDGPLPIVDLLALAGVVWTGYDLYQMQSQFEIEVRDSTKSKLYGIRDAVNSQARTFAEGKFVAFNKLQASMGNQTNDRFKQGAGS